jgi:transcriptional regulator with XRE-family HTH domain
MTQEQLADAVGTDKGVISLLESGARGLSDKWLRRLAPILKTSAGHLLDHDPNDLPTDIIDIWASIPERDKGTAKRVLESFRKRA